MSERMRQAVGTILGAGFQVESDAFKTLVEIGGGATLDKLVEEVLKMANAAAPRPMSISRDLVLKAAEQLDLSSKSLFSETGLVGREGLRRRFLHGLKWSLTLRGSSGRPGLSTISSITSGAV